MPHGVRSVGIQSLIVPLGVAKIVHDSLNCERTLMPSLYELFMGEIYPKLCLISRQNRYSQGI